MWSFLKDHELCLEEIVARAVIPGEFEGCEDDPGSPIVEQVHGPGDQW